MTCLVIALLCFAIVPGSFSDEDIHKNMTREEVQQVFHTDYESVPKYEIVKVHLSKRLHKRDLPEGSKIHIRAFGEDINLWLHSTDSILAGEDTPVYYARYSSNEPEGVKFSRRDGLMRMVGRIFEDPDNLASLVIGTDDSGRRTVNGYVASKRVAIRSLPTHVAQEYRRRRRSVGDFYDSDSNYHVVFEVPKAHEENYSVTPVNKTTLRKRAAQFVSAIPDTLYPEILVVLDYSMHSAYGRDIYGLLQYLLAFWNGVDLKYRSLDSPKVRFHISGIILAEDPYVPSYISRNALSAKAFNAEKAMSDATTFYNGVKDSFPLDSYDISVTLSRQDFGLDGAASVLGKAWPGSACKHEADKNWAVSIVQDNGAFSGVFTTAHELGHLLGAHHDPSNDECKYSNGFIMSLTPWYTKNSSDFSSCSIKDLNDQLKTTKLECLFNRPGKSGKSLPKLMPGRMKSLEDQCRALNLRAPCQDKSAPSDVCVNIFCLDDNGECKETGTAALDGTSCEGINKFCLHMRCISL